MVNTPVLPLNIKNYPALLAFLSVTTLIVLLCLVFEPRWQSNDDVAMSMIAHGYGIAAYGSPNLVFSNVLWGYLVRTLPTINGVLGYSIATMTVLFVAIGAIFYFLLRLNIGYLVGLLAATLLIATPLLFAQFTVNSGLLTVAAIVGWQTYAQIGGKSNLVLACLLAFCGFLIRDSEFLLVLGVSLPLLPWLALREQRQLKIAFFLLSIAIALAATFDRWSYTGVEWQQFKELNTARLPFTDYGANLYLKQRPELLAQHHYSANDVELIRDWFFVDSKIADPQTLSTILSELGPVSMQTGNIQSGFVSIKTLLEPMLLPLFLAALLFLILTPQRSVILVWILCLTALFSIGIMGRPGMLRIYIPLVSLLLVAPFVVEKYKQTAPQWLIALALFGVCVGNFYVLVPKILSANQWMQKIQTDIQGIPDEPIISWGNTFPVELVYPVLANNSHARNIKLYGLDSFTYAPFSVANSEQILGRGMLGRLQTTEGIPIMTTPKQIETLRIYCSEHLNGRLHEMIRQQTSWLVVRQVRCLPNQ
jgi:hypothetical protein